jgi:cytochrome c biogenesis protein CcdA
VLLSLLALALVDSINPSAIVVTLYLLSRERAAPQVIIYISTIFLTYLTLGALMMLGVDAVLWSLPISADGRLGLLVQGLIGLAMLVYALVAPTTAQPRPAAPRASTFAALALLGLTVTVMELPTAVPYFGAIALLTSADLPAAQWLPILILYNVIFVMPPLVLLAGHVALGKRLETRYTMLRERLQTGARETLLWIVGLVGGALLVTSAVEYVARFVR